MFIYTRRNKSFGNPPDLRRCRASVTGDCGAYFSHQCTRPASVRRKVDGTEYGFCKQHDPERVKQQHDKRLADWQAKWDARDQRERERQQHQALLEACKAALEQIAAGHNDPRSLAVEVLNKHYEVPE